MATNYISVTDICPARIPTNRLLQLVDDANLGFGQGGVFQTGQLAIINAIIADAENEAEGYASKRYSVADLRAKKPAAFLVKIKDLAEAGLFGRRPPLVADLATKREQAIAWLNGLKTGGDSLGLDVPVAEKPANAGGHAAVITGPEPQMDSKSLQGF